ncbi:MAG TPA: cytochrome P450 [Pyrinomonadaceae bacterium]|jgi:cytochrome P450|nr:cytochrome P450 [Pyrinomonadaceae bacterium]
MNLLPHSLPRAAKVEGLYDEPLGFLSRARSSLGDMFVLREAGPIFSRSPDCAGAIAVFGPALNRAVLSDIDLFGMPISAAEHLGLPQTLVNLNCGLHSMRGEQHTQHQRLLLRVLSERSIEEQHSAVSTDLEMFLNSWQAGQGISLLGEMRRLALQVSKGLLFGDQYKESARLASLLQEYFQFRREAASPLNSASATMREELIALGTSLDDALRQHIHWARRQSLITSDGLLTRLACMELEPGNGLAEDALVAHGNVLFMSSNEPVAVALCWILLILSQLPELRRALRRELVQAEIKDSVPCPQQLARLTLLDAVVSESLRLLTPNALMARVTTRPTELGGVKLPARCELVLSPFLAHRDAERFPRPTEFLPSRWNALRPAPYEYFPFGAGGHACVGRQLAMYLIKATLALMMPRYELLLADDQEIDWRIHIQFMPRNEPLMRVCAAGDSNLRAGKMLGPICELISLDSYHF